jgi:UDP-perosamine 4-acetyltransferase
MELIVVGGGGHAKVALDVLRLMASMTVIGVADPAAAGSTILGIPVLGGDEVLAGLRDRGIAAAFVAIGDNGKRQRLGATLQEMGFVLPVILHPSAIVSPSAQIGAGSAIMAGAKIGPDAVIGELAIINTGAIVEHDVRVGIAAHVAPGCALAGCVRVGDRALIGIGSAARPGVWIGDDVTVGAGSTVVTDLSDGIVVAGNPARPLAKKDDT